MYVTGQDAAALWCPQARAGAYAENRDLGAALAHELTRCVGARCAMWRFETPGAVRRRFLLADDHLAESEPSNPPPAVAGWTFTPADRAEGDPAGWQEPYLDAAMRRTGFCGLAGRPA